MPIAILQFFAGGAGGLIRALVGMSKSQTFNPDTFKFQWKYFAFSILVSILVGQMSAIVFNSDWRMSLLAGYAGSDLLESLYKLKFAQFFKTP
jgi:hypothetical protein